MRSLLYIAFVTVFLGGCLKTRSEVKDNEKNQVMQQQVVTLQRTNADTNSKFSEFEEQMRDLNGRVDVLENHIQQGNSGVDRVLKSTQQQSTESNQKIALLQEALTKMEAQVAQLSTQIEALKAQIAANAAAAATAAAEEKKEAAASSKKRKDSFETGQEFFDKKDWKQAVLNYQKYRDDLPKGKHVSEATYKMGVCFQELGMNDEAKTFYDDVIAKFPKSDDARRARTRLKAMKK